MARAYAQITVLDDKGNAQSGVEVTIYDEDGTTLLSQSMYAADTGLTTKANPLTTNSRGVAFAYTDTPQRAVAAYSGQTITFDFSDNPSDIGDSVPSDGATLTDATISGSTISSSDITGCNIVLSNFDAPDIVVEGSHPAAPAANRMRLYAYDEDLWARKGTAGTAFQLARSTDINNQPSPIPNGGFQLWQEGIAFTSVADGTWGPDGWVYLKSGAVVHDVKKSVDLPTIAADAPFTGAALHLDVTTADATLAAGDYSAIATRLEGYRWAPYATQAFSLGFWVKAAKAGVHCVYVTNSGADRSFVGEYTIGTADTWEYHTISVPASPTAGTWDYAAGRGVEIGWTQAAGTTFHTGAGAWATGNYKATANQVNEGDSTANNFRLSHVSMNLGTAARPFVLREFDDAVREAKRYYQASYDLGSPGGTATTTGWHRVLLSDNDTAKIVITTVPFPVEMRATPTVYSYDAAGNGGTGAAARLTTYLADGSVGANDVAATLTASTKKLEVFGSGTIAGIAFQYVATARIP